MTALPQGSANEARLLVQGADRPGVVAAVSQVLADAKANIVSMNQYSTDPEGGRFFQRAVFHLDNLEDQRAALTDTLDNALVNELGLTYQLIPASTPKRVAIFASKADHCLLDLIGRQRRGEINMTIPMVISNHPDLGDHVRYLGVDFIHLPINKDTKQEVEQEHLRLLKDNVDLVVLARYMQILSGNFLDNVGVPVINIHHSFLPAFIGANPYMQARRRGVKLIGATAHYVTEDLDEGPIIEQDVVRATHQDSTLDLQRRGAHVERQVLSRAVTWHCEDRVIRDGNATVVF